MYTSQISFITTIQRNAASSKVITSETYIHSYAWDFGICWFGSFTPLTIKLCGSSMHAWSPLIIFKICSFHASVLFTSSVCIQLKSKSWKIFAPTAISLNKEENAGVAHFCFFLFAFRGSQRTQKVVVPCSIWYALKYYQPHHHRILHSSIIRACSWDSQKMNCLLM